MSDETELGSIAGDERIPLSSLNPLSVVVVVRARNGKGRLDFKGDILLLDSYYGFNQLSSLPLKASSKLYPLYR